MVSEQRILPIYLAATVPIWIDHLLMLDPATFEKTRQRWVVQQSTTKPVVETEDISLILRTRAQAIAAQAFSPDGVEAFGMHWEAWRTSEMPQA